MKKNLLCITVSFIALSLNAQKAGKHDRLFVNLGSGPSYSLFYASGGWVRDFGDANFNNITPKRNAWAFSHFAELEWRFRNPRWSLRGGYSMHHFAPKFKASGFTIDDNAYYEIDTREADNYTYLQSTVQYALVQGKDRVELGTGFYIQLNKRQGIEYYDQISTPNTGGGVTAFFVHTYTSSEAGFPVNLDYTHFLNNGNGIGARFNFNYSVSVDTPEHLAWQLFFKAKLK